MNLGDTIVSWWDDTKQAVTDGVEGYFGNGDIAQTYATKRTDQSEELDFNRGQSTTEELDFNKGYQTTSITDKIFERESQKEQNGQQSGQTGQPLVGQVADGSIPVEGSTPTAGYSAGIPVEDVNVQAAGINWNPASSWLQAEPNPPAVTTNANNNTDLPPGFEPVAARPDMSGVEDPRNVSGGASFGTNGVLAGLSPEEQDAKLNEINNSALNNPALNTVDPVVGSGVDPVVDPVVDPLKKAALSGANNKVEPPPVVKGPPGEVPPPAPEVTPPPPPPAPINQYGPNTPGYNTWGRVNPDGTVRAMTPEEMVQSGQLEKKNWYTENVVKPLEETGDDIGKGAMKWVVDPLSRSLAGTTASTNPEGWGGVMSGFFSNPNVQRALLGAAVGVVAGKQGKGDSLLLGLEGAVRGFRARPDKEHALAMIDKFGDFILEEDREAYAEAIRTDNYGLIAQLGAKGYEADREAELAKNKKAEWGIEGSAETGYFQYNKYTGQIKPITEEQRKELGLTDPGTGAKWTLVNSGEPFTRTVKNNDGTSEEVTGMWETDGKGNYRVMGQPIEDNTAGQGIIIKVKNTLNNNAFTDSGGNTMANADGIAYVNFNSDGFQNAFGENGIRQLSKSWQAKALNTMATLANGNAASLELTEEQILASLSKEGAKSFSGLMTLSTEYVAMKKKENQGQGEYTDSDAAIDMDRAGLNPLLPPEVLAANMEKATAEIMLGNKEITPEKYGEILKEIDGKYSSSTKVGGEVFKYGTSRKAGGMTFTFFGFGPEGKPIWR